MKVRSLFLSDVHLGSRGCQAHHVLDFLSTYEPDTLYLIGDIIDGWQLQSRWYWPDSHSAVLARLAAVAAAGVEVIYLPGNHDDFAADSQVLRRLGFTIRDQHVHVGPDQRRYLVLHGDKFDRIERHARWLSRIAGRAYQAVVLLNAYANRIGQRLGLRYYPYAAWIKRHFKAVMRFISEFEANLSGEAQRQGHVGVICGHIHHPALHQDEGFCYMNTGDWVESCSAIVEHPDGQFELIRWNQARAPKRRGIPALAAGKVFSRIGMMAFSAGMVSVAFGLRIIITCLRWPFAA